jgi:hypothetical protein
MPLPKYLLDKFHKESPARTVTLPPGASSGFAALRETFVDGTGSVRMAGDTRISIVGDARVLDAKVLDATARDGVFDGVTEIGRAARRSGTIGVTAGALTEWEKGSRLPGSVPVARLAVFAPARTGEASALLRGAIAASAGCVISR